MSDDAAEPFTTRQRWGWNVALALTLLRLALAPVLVVMLWARFPGWTFAAVLVLGFVSDVYDGVVARRFHAATPFLRRLDSAVDIVFYLAVAYATWRLHPDALRAVKWWVLSIIAGEAGNHVVALKKFGREPSYHAWTAKLWGLLLFLSLLLLLATGSGAMLPFAIAAGLLAQLEVLAITAVLPEWRHDVKSLWHARRERRDVDSD